MLLATPTFSRRPFRLNTRLYLAAHKPLKQENSSYRHLLREVGTGGNEVTIPRTTTTSDMPVRAWNDIFYPASHTYPVDQFGEFDAAAAILMNGTSNALQDAVSLQGMSPSKTVVYDEEGRPSTSSWTSDGTKDYSSMLSSNISNLTYWTIDNQQYGDYRLEFEYFDLNPNAYGPPTTPSPL